MSKPAQVGDFCPNPDCADYGKLQSEDQTNIIRFGKTKAGRQRFKCKTCADTFVETKGTIFYRRRTPGREIIEALALIADRLAVIGDLLAENQTKLKRVLDLYLSGDFDREMLMERKTRLKTMIDDLEREQAELTVRLEAQALTDERIEGIMARMAKMRKGLEKAEGDFKKQRRFIEELSLTASLAVEDGKKVAHVKCYIGEETLSIVSNSSGTLDTPYMIPLSPMGVKPGRRRPLVWTTILSFTSRNWPAS